MRYAMTFIGDNYSFFLGIVVSQNVGNYTYLYEAPKGAKKRDFSGEHEIIARTVHLSGARFHIIVF